MSELTDDRSHLRELEVQRLELVRQIWELARSAETGLGRQVRMGIEGTSFVTVRRRTTSDRIAHHRSCDPLAAPRSTTRQRPR